MSAHVHGPNRAKVHGVWCKRFCCSVLLHDANDHEPVTSVNGNISDISASSYAILPSLLYIKPGHMMTILSSCDLG